MPEPPFTVDVAALALGPVRALPAEQVLDGAPAVAEQALITTADGRHETGVWEITPGVSTDVEAEETFVVISGSATVEIEGGPTLQLAPGVAGAFAAGARTTWRVTETLRKVYTATLD
jgi:uncharacterized cupin superfamily protein